MAEVTNELMAIKPVLLLGRILGRRGMQGCRSGSLRSRSLQVDGNTDEREEWVMSTRGHQYNSPSRWLGQDCRGYTGESSPW